MSYRNQSNAAANVYQTESVARGSLTANVEATGTVRAGQSATLIWNTSGRVKSVQGSVGDAVTANQVLAWLEAGSLSGEVTLAESDLVSAQQELDSLANSNSKQAQAMQTLADAKQTVQDAEDTLDFYERTSKARVSEELLKDYREQIKQSKDQLKMVTWVYNRFLGYDKMDAGRTEKARMTVTLTNLNQNLIDLIANYNWYTGKPGELLMEQTRAELALAKAKLEDAQRELDRLNNGGNMDDLKAARARVAAAQSTINQSKIVAPFNGTLTQAEPQSGDRVSAGQTAFRLDDLSRLSIDLQISEVDINRVTVDLPVTITFDAVQNKVYNGIVIKVNQSADESKGAANYSVTVKLMDADELVKPGMTASVNIVCPTAR
jgi:HlyD family secretion protein